MGVPGGGAGGSRHTETNAMGIASEGADRTGIPPVIIDTAFRFLTAAGWGATLP